VFLCTSDICQLFVCKKSLVGYTLIALGLQDKFKNVVG